MATAGAEEINQKVPTAAGAQQSFQFKVQEYINRFKPKLGKCLPDDESRR